jgi:glucose/arabinose dehydrogenase
MPSAAARRSVLLIGLAITAIALAACAGGSTDLPAGFEREGGSVVVQEWPSAAAILPDQPRGRLPPGFHDEPVIDGLDSPTGFAVAADERVFVIEQSGIVKLYEDGAQGMRQQLLLDLRTQVYRTGQTGLLGIALDPDFDDQPYLYLAYTHDAPMGGSAPTHGQPDEDIDTCSTLPTASCVVSGRVSRFRLERDGRVGPEQVLVEDWCAYSTVHTIGTIAFGSDGALYAGGGDGAHGARFDYGQLSRPLNACAGPDDVGRPIGPSTAAGGALASQDTTNLNGTIIRVDRSTGKAVGDDQPADASAGVDRRIVAYGLRNPFRFTLRPGSDELWIADVGWELYEELNVLANPGQGRPVNFGWPCYEGPYRQPQHEALGGAICLDLYDAEPDSVQHPVFAMGRRDAGPDTCDAARSALSGITFHSGQSFPAEYAGALFLADVERGCMWVIEAANDGHPRYGSVRLFGSGIRPVDLQQAPDGNLYYVDYIAGTLNRISYQAMD